MDGANFSDLRAFGWAPMARYSKDTRIRSKRGWSPYSGVILPDFLRGEIEPADEGLDRFGWQWSGGDLLSHHPALYHLNDASVLRRSLGRDRWHVILDEGICATDSYHDGKWLGPHIGETVRMGTAGASVVANLMDNAPLDARVRKPAVLIGHFWAENYAHTLLETASRFWAFETNPELHDMPIVWDLNRPWQKEVAGMLGAGNVKSLPANHVRFDELYVPSFFSQIGSSKASVAWLRKRFGAPDGPGKRRIYVSRADATERRIKNENEILEMLRPMGFECVMLTGMSVEEQRNLFRDIEIAVMPHGAACANMIFAGKSAKLVEIVPKSYPHHMFWHIAKWSDQWYGRIVCDDGENKDMAVDPLVISSALEAAGL